MAKNNPRYECRGCKARNTRNQLKGSNGLCIHCKTAMHHTSWLGGQAGNICQLVSLSKGDELALFNMAEEASVNMTELIRAAVQNSLTVWEQAPDRVKTIKADMLLGKLSQR